MNTNTTFTVAKIDRDDTVVKTIPADSKQDANVIADAIHFGSKCRAEVCENGGDE